MQPEMDIKFMIPHDEGKWDKCKCSHAERYHTLPVYSATGDMIGYKCKYASCRKLCRVFTKKEVK